MSAASSSSAAAAAQTHSSHAHAPHAAAQPHHRPATGSSSSSSSSSKPATHHSHPPAFSASSSSASSSSSSSSSRARSSSTRMFAYSRSCPNPWHITAAHLSTASPSLADGIPLAAQTLLRAETADFVSQMGQQCKITQWAIATGSVYLHVFFTRFSFARFDRFEVAATCLFLAGKVEERRTRVDQVINAYYHVRLNPPAASSSALSSSSSSSPSGSGSSSSLTAAIHLLPPSPSSPEYEALRQRIYSLEFALLDAIEFVFEVSHPYTNLMLFLKDTIFGPKYANKPASWIHKETSEKGGLAQIAWLFINDSLRSTLCLQYPPDLICVGVISLSLTYKQYEQPVRAGGAQARPWHEELFDVDRQTLDYISDVILTCVEQRYKPDPQQAQALLSSSAALPVNTQLPTLQPPPSMAPLLAAPSSSALHKSRGLPASNATQRQQHPSAHRDRDGHAHHRPSAELTATAAPEGIERVVPKSMQQQQQQHQQGIGGAASSSTDRKRGRFPMPPQPPAVDHSQRAAPSLFANAPPPQRITVSSSQPKPAAAAASSSSSSSSSGPAPKRGGYVWKPPPKNRRPAATTATEDAGQKQQQPAAPTRPLTPSTPPSPELSAGSPLSRPPSPFLQSPLSASKRRREGDDGPAGSSAASTASTASNSSTAFPFSRKRPHSPASPPRSQFALSASSSALSRVDSRGETERTLVEQIGLKMRFESAGKRAKEEGELSDTDEAARSGSFHATLPAAAADEEGEAGKAVEEQKEEAAAGVTRYFLDGLDVMKGGGRSDKRDDAEVMEDIHKMREEMEGEAEAGDAEHAAAAAAARSRPSPRLTDEDDEDDDDDGRVWKRPRHDDEGPGAYSPLATPFLHAEEDVRGEEPGTTAAAAGAAEQREGETDDACGPEAEFAPSSPHAGDESEHHLDSFSAVKQRRDDGEEGASPLHLTQGKEGDADGHAPPLLSV